MSTTRRNLLLSMAALGIFEDAMAQEAFPSKPIRWVVPWVPGSPGDYVARLVGERMAHDLGQPVIVDNKSGATGTAAIPEVLRQPADGHTMYYLGAASLLGPMLYPNAGIDFAKQFSAVGGLDTVSSVVVTGTSKPYSTLSDLIAAAKAQPDVLTYASAGSGSPPHLMTEMFKQKVDAKITHVPYAQVGQAVTDVISGRVDVMFMGAPVAIPLIKGGRLRPLAVTSAQRSAQLPHVPTVDEAGAKGFVYVSFDGLLVRSGTPEPVIRRLSDSLRAALASSVVREAFTKNGLEVLPMNAAQFQEHMANESRRLLALAKQVGVKLE